MSIPIRPARAMQPAHQCAARVSSTRRRASSGQQANKHEQLRDAEPERVRYAVSLLRHPHPEPFAADHGGRNCLRERRGQRDFDNALTRVENLRAPMQCSKRTLKPVRWRCTYNDRSRRVISLLRKKICSWDYRTRCLYTEGVAGSAVSIATT
ncbi:hypothetical protein ACPUER_05920 [Burkholderia sp. DN3021]|uniref:hypothetical protein n=1 Tax=Burkholderia sp. DN3021 TaxID=3410137 RepID=UPI003C7BD0D1